MWHNDNKKNSSKTTLYVYIILNNFHVKLWDNVLWMAGSELTTPLTYEMGKIHSNTSYPNLNILIKKIINWDYQ